MARLVMDRATEAPPVRRMIEESRRLTLCDALEATEGESSLSAEVTIIRPGTSGNGWTYPELTLREATPLFEGTAAFCDHAGPLDNGRAGGRSVRDLVGVYENARYEDGIKATLRFYPNAQWLCDLVRATAEDRRRGRAAPAIGISGDMVVAWQPGAARGERLVRQIRAVRSADVVYRPAAGGTIDSVSESIREGESDMELNETIGQDTVVAENEANALRATRQAACRELLELKLAASGLPTSVNDRIRGRFAERVFEARNLDDAVDEMRGILADLTAAQTVNGMGGERSNVSVGKTPYEKVKTALEALLGLPVSDPSVPRLSGIREAYILLTGDKHFTGRFCPEEALIQEANEVTTSVLNDALGNALNKRLVADYRTQPKWWAPLVSTVPLKNMQTQTRILLNDFASLSTVVENGPYTNLSWGDTKETYAPFKVGNLVTITLESIINDDLRAVTRVPQKLASAAAVTINEAVAYLFTQNTGTGPVMADTYNVFDAVHHQGNLGIDALDSASLEAALITMARYTNSAGKRLGIRPRYLVVPPDLAFSASILLNSTQMPFLSGDTVAKNDINPFRGIVDLVVSPNFTDANNWYLLADPAQVEGIEVGFLDGRAEPELLVQDSPTAGAVFTNDAIAFKVRWVFGLGWLDYRAAHGSVVA